MPLVHHFPRVGFCLRFVLGSIIMPNYVTTLAEIDIDEYKSNLLAQVACTAAYEYK